MICEVLFPEICNLYGDMMNSEYLQKSCPALERRFTGLKDRPYFADAVPDMISIGSATERGQELALEALRPWKTRLKELVEGGTLFLVTGNAQELFGSRICCEDGRVIEGLGFYSAEARRDMLHRYNAPFLGSFRGETVVGYKSQFSHMYGGDETEALFQCEKGVGRNPDCKAEGFRINRFLATCLLGPITVLNPAFTRRLLEMLGVSDPHPAFEEAAEDAFRFRVEEFRSEKQQY